MCIAQFKLTTQGSGHPVMSRDRPSFIAERLVGSEMQFSEFVNKFMQCPHRHQIPAQHEARL
jgi:hypothetical protein